MPTTRRLRRSSRQYLASKAGMSFANDSAISSTSLSARATSSISLCDSRFRIAVIPFVEIEHLRERPLAGFFHGLGVHFRATDYLVAEQSQPSDLAPLPQF